MGPAFFCVFKTRRRRGVPALVNSITLPKAAFPAKSIFLSPHRQAEACPSMDVLAKDAAGVEGHNSLCPPW